MDDVIAALTTRTRVSVCARRMSQTHHQRAVLQFVNPFELDSNKLKMLVSRFFWLLQCHGTRADQKGYNPFSVIINSD